MVSRNFYDFVDDCRVTDARQLRASPPFFSYSAREEIRPKPCNWTVRMIFNFSESPAAKIQDFARKSPAMLSYDFRWIKYLGVYVTYVTQSRFRCRLFAGSWKLSINFTKCRAKNNRRAGLLVNAADWFHFAKATYLVFFLPVKLLSIFNEKNREIYLSTFNNNF